MPVPGTSPFKFPPGCALFCQHLFDPGVGSDGSVVGSGQPEGLIPQHPVVPHKDVLKGGIQGMPHVKRSGDVGRRNHNGEPGFARDNVGFKQIVIHPIFVPFALETLGLISLGQGSEPWSWLFAMMLTSLPLERILVAKTLYTPENLRPENLRSLTAG